MIRHLLKRSIKKHKDMILEESVQINGFMKLLMKPRNTGTGWTKQEKAQIRKHLKHLSFYVPALVIFLAPFGSLLIPVLAEILDRRKNKRT
ncbi:MAG TPA: hypothetical protein PKM08_09190 [Syntrophorhabdaceae bacterium]|nr:hypothetical protein [Syntrophorhabdaceae bacterium]HNT69634.1 hypothetical protein [Syntrophorhabdaceae bacterium]